MSITRYEIEVFGLAGLEGWIFTGVRRRSLAGARTVATAYRRHHGLPTRLVAMERCRPVAVVDEVGATERQAVFAWGSA